MTAMRVSGSLAPNETGPVAIQSVQQGNGSVTENKVRPERVFPAKVGQVAKDMLGLVVSSGTGKAAQVGDEFIWGKTGTTENYGDAWFVGGNDDLTVAIWVGYADKLQPMEFEHAGSPVAGGTFPAEIFDDFMASWLEMREQRRAERAASRDDGTDSTTPAVPVAPTDVPPTEEAAPTETAPADEGGAAAHAGAQRAAAAACARPRAGSHAGPADQTRRPPEAGTEAARAQAARASRRYRTGALGTPGRCRWQTPTHGPQGRSRPRASRRRTGSPPWRCRRLGSAAGTVADTSV